MWNIRIHGFVDHVTMDSEEDFDLKPHCYVAQWCLVMMNLCSVSHSAPFLLATQGSGNLAVDLLTKKTKEKNNRRSLVSKPSLERFVIIPFFPFLSFTPRLSRPVAETFRPSALSPIHSHFTPVSLGSHTSNILIFFQPACPGCCTFKISGGGARSSEL